MPKGIRLRPEVRKFAEAMEQKLRQNDFKSPWCDCDVDWLYRKAKGELLELAGSILEKSSSVLNEAADCANYLMMIADNCGLLKETE